MDSRTLTALVILSSFLATVSATDIFLPSLPGMAEYFGSSPEALQSTISVYLFAQLGSAPLWGTLADRFGRRRMLFWGMSLFLMGSLLCVSAVSVPMLIAARVLQGIGAVSCPIIGWATLSDLYPKDESIRIMSIMGGVMTVAPLVAPTLGGVIDEAFGWRVNFLCIFIIALVSLLLLVFGRFDPGNTSERDRFHLLGTFKGYVKVIANRSLVGYVLVFAFLSAGEFTYLTIAPFYLEMQHGYEADDIGYFISIAAFAYVVGAFGANRIAKRFGVDQSFAIGIAFAALAGFILMGAATVFAPSARIFAIAAAFYLFGLSLVWGPATSRALQQVPSTQRGSASAVRSLLLTMVQFLGAELGTLMPDSSLQPLGLVFFAFAMCSMLAFLVAKRSEPS